MTAEQAFIALAVEAALAFAIVGLAVRGRWRLAWCFTAYLVAVLLGNVLITWWPSRFFNYTFYVLKESLYGGLKLATFVEIGWCTSRPFPGSASITHRRLLWMLTLLTTALLVARVPWDVLGTLGEPLARLQIGAVWLAVAVLASSYWYRLPTHPFHVAVVASLALYSAIFGILLRMHWMAGWWTLPYFNALNQPSYLAVVFWWGWVAWRPEPETTAVHRATLARIAAARQWV